MWKFPGSCPDPDSPPASVSSRLDGACTTSSIHHLRLTSSMIPEAWKARSITTCMMSCTLPSIQACTSSSSNIYMPTHTTARGSAKEADSCLACLTTISTYILGR